MLLITPFNDLFEGCAFRIKIGHRFQTQRHPAGASVFGYVYGTRSRGKRGCCISPQNKGLLHQPQNNTGQLTMCCPGFCIYLICSKTDRQRCSGTMKTNKNKSQ